VTYYLKSSERGALTLPGGKTMKNCSGNTSLLLMMSAKANPYFTGLQETGSGDTFAA